MAFCHRHSLLASPIARAVDCGECAARRRRNRPDRRDEVQKTDGDRIQVSTAPGPDGIVRRIEVRAREGNTNWAVFALTNNSDEQIDRLIVAPHYRMVGSGLFWPDLGLSRIVSHYAVDRRSARSGRTAFDRRHLPHHARSRHRHHLRRRTAHRQAAADLSVGAGRLQGQGQQLHALPRHRHRHRRPARAVSDHPVRGEGHGHVSGRRRARLGGARLHRHRFRLLGQGVRHVRRRRAHVARLRRGDPGGDAAGLPLRLSESQSRGMCATPISPSPGLPALAALVARRRVRSERSPPASRACRLPASPSFGFALVHLSLDARLRPRDDADPDLAPAGLLGGRPPASPSPGASPTTSSARRCSAAWC